MRMLQTLLGVTLVAVFVSTSQAALPLGGAVDGIALGYDPVDGNLRLNAAGHVITTLEIISAAGYFTGSPPDGLVQPPFDVFTPTKYFLLKTDGIGDTDLGNVLPTGLSRDALGADLTVQGSIKPSGGLGVVSLYLVPEPSSVLLLGFGLLGLLGLRRKCLMIRA